MESFLNSCSQRLVDHATSSYDDFIDTQLNAVLQANPLLIFKRYLDPSKASDSMKATARTHVYPYELDFKITNPRLVRHPNVTPSMCRSRKETYAGDLCVDIEVQATIRNVSTGEVTYNKQSVATQKAFILGQIPIMVQSKYCALGEHPSIETRAAFGECRRDPGGYFIIDGMEKVVVSQETNSGNRVHVYRGTGTFKPAWSRIDSKNKISADRTLTKLGHKIGNKEDYLYISEVRSQAPGQAPQTAHVRIRNDGTFQVGMGGHVRTEVPLFAVFKALGVETDKEIMQYIVGDLDDVPDVLTDLFEESANETQGLITQQQCLELIASYTKFPPSSTPSAQKRNESTTVLDDWEIHLMMLIASKFLPHVGTNLLTKARFLGHMTRRLALVAIGVAPETDRDSLRFRRIQTPGVLLEGVFRDFVKSMAQKTRNVIDQKVAYLSEFSDKQFLSVVTDASLPKIVGVGNITTFMRKSFKGRWGSKGVEGIVQDLSRLSFFGTLDHLRRVHYPIPSEAKIAAMRRLHGSQYGFFCPVDTPDGGNIGSIKHLALGAIVSKATDPNELERICFSEEYGVVETTSVSVTDSHRLTKVFVDGKWIGVVKNARALVKALTNLRRNKIAFNQIGIFFDRPAREVYVGCDTGRMLRPVFYRSPTSDELSKSWKDLAAPGGPVEYVDADELECTLIATSINTFDQNVHTHAEIDGALIASPLVAANAYTFHNASSRQLFSAGHMRQAVSVYATNFRNRFDQSAMVLATPQLPLCNSPVFSALTGDECPYGSTIIMAIASFTGRNQEDSVIFKKEAIDRGLFATLYTKGYALQISEKPIGSIRKAVANANLRGETFVFAANPVDVEASGRNPNWDYSKLDARGIIRETEPDVNVRVNDDRGPELTRQLGVGATAIVRGRNGKVRTVHKDDHTIDVYFGEKPVEITDRTVVLGAVQYVNDVLVDASHVLSRGTHGVVDKLYVSRKKTEYGNRKYNIDYDKDLPTATPEFPVTLELNIVVRDTRHPILGDKFVARSAQKGTIGAIMNECDMPYDEKGVVPDVIMNPHGHPTRKTAGHFLEMFEGIVGCEYGFRPAVLPFPKDGTHGYDRIEACQQLLQKVGRDKNGESRMFSPETGKPMNTLFCGPIYYMRLKQQVTDKIQCRSGYPHRPPVNALTRQPTHGRKTEGGLRIGEMERDSILAHGTAQFLKETMFDRADAFEVVLDRNTGFIHTPRHDDRVAHTAPTHTARCQLPFAFKLLVQELEAMGVSTRIKT